MQQPLRPDPSKPLPSATGVLRLHPDDANFDADFADLAARFAQSGGGLSPQLSADLALEIVLNEIVEQACLATGATGAAIVLQRDGEFVCRASNGATAPELGSRLDTISGLSGECLRTRRTQRCDDVLADPRADAAASQRLGVRSVMVMPLLRGEELVGVFELFSSLPFAFGDRDEGTLEILADRTLNNLERAVHPPAPQVASPPAPQPMVEPLPVAAPEAVPPVAGTPVEELPVADVPDAEASAEEEHAPQHTYDFVTTLLGVAVVICAVSLGVLLGRHWGFRRVPASPRPAVTATSSTPSTPAPVSSTAAAAPSTETKPAPPQPPSAKPNSSPAVPPGGLLVYENGKEVFRMAPARSQGDAAEPASPVEPVRLSPAAAQGSLLHRVEPDYPQQARQQHIQGAVVLDVRIGADGAVQDVQQVSGPPELAQASTDAVKQWRFKPRNVNGHPVEMQTRVTLNFRLPQ